MSVQLKTQQCEVRWGDIKGKGYSAQSGSDKLKPKSRIGTAVFQMEETTYVKDLR